MENKLLGCPFCGIKLQCKGGDFYFHGKADCILSEFEFDGLSERDWNTRAQPELAKVKKQWEESAEFASTKLMQPEHEKPRQERGKQHPTSSDEVDAIAEEVSELFSLNAEGTLSKPWFKLQLKTAIKQALHSLIESSKHVQADVEKSKQLLCAIFGGLPDDCISMSIEQLANQNERMREALEKVDDYLNNRHEPEVIRDANVKIAVKEALKSLPPSQFVK